MLTLEQIWRGDPLEVVIEGYGFTGEGYVRLEDGWLSVRGALPGERVSVVIEPGQREGQRRLWCKLLEVVEEVAGVGKSVRCDPLCEHASRCRGCQLRHMTMREELRWKSEMIAQVVERYGLVPMAQQPPVELLVVPGLWRGDSERMRSGLSYRRVAGASGSEACELGLVVPGESGLVPMRDCPALIEPLKRLIRAIEAGFEGLSAQGMLPSDVRDEDGALLQVRVSCPVHGRGMVVVELGGQGPLDVLPAWFKRWLEVVRLAEHISVFAVRQEHVVHVRGPSRLRLPIAGVTLEIGPTDWFHATLRPAETLYEHVLEWLAPEPTERFLDVGCGVGTIGVMMASRVSHVVGVDINRDSVETAQLNAFAMNRENMEVVAGSWENALRRLTIAGQRFDVATINPMREPLGERALAYLGPLGVRRVMYLGPSSVSAARDVGVLQGQGWRLSRLGQAALHPATHHTMLVALMER